MMQHFKFRGVDLSTSALRASVLVLTLSPALYAQAPAGPAAADDAPDASRVAPTDAPAAPVTPTAPDPARSKLGAPTTLTLRPSRLHVRRTAAPGSKAALTQRSIQSEDPSIDLHEPPSEPSAPAAPVPDLSVWLGVGNLWVPSRGLDPFAKDDALTAFSAGAALSLATLGSLDIAAVAGFDLAASDANFRGEATSLGLTRLALGPELRASLLDRLYWHGRLTPTVTHLSAGLDETSSGATLSDQRWVWGVEAALGLELRFAEAPTSLSRAIGFFARIEGGYAWSPGATLELEPGSGAPVRTAPLELGELALAGPIFRANVGVGF